MHDAAAGSPEALKCPSQYSLPGRALPSHAYMATLSIFSSYFVKGSSLVKEIRIWFSFFPWISCDVDFF